MHIDDIEKVQALDAKRRKLMTCYSMFDRMKNMDFRLVADYEHAGNDHVPWTRVDFIPVPGRVALEMCSAQLTAVETEMRELGVETAPRS